MRKRIGDYQLNRDTTARQALFRNLVTSLVTKESIETTKAKAAAVRPIAEKLITTAKTGTVHARRQIQAFVQDPAIVKKLAGDLAARFKDVHGGYTRTIPVGTRRGDAAQIVRLSLTKLAAPKVAAPSKINKTIESSEAKAVAAPAPAVSAPKVAKPRVTVKKSTKPTIGVRRGER